MAGHKYVNPNNLFEDEEDVDDDTFVNAYRSRNPPPSAVTRPANTSSTAYGGHIANLERQRQVMLERQREIEQRTLDSSARSVQLLRDSENIGIATAEELARQRDALDNTNRRLDEINTNLNTTQKHLNGIKSVFWGLKNYISGKSEQPPSRSQASPNSQTGRVGASSSRLNETLDNLGPMSSGIGDNYNSHPSTRLRGMNEQTMADPVTDSDRVNKMLDANLDEMVHAITRLKGLGAALGDEIEQQNDLIDTIQDKVEGADIKIGRQNKTMNKLLGK
ncbi:soluble NSF attachment protein 29 [Cydia strobilella]|uniref:soluble NSF attachment protein 29 n=1 Tax=Cydia strobilella TaxID=1100964 RepID=UPI0030046B5F